MGIYLDKLRSTLNTVQARQITNLLRKQKDSGEIRNLEEFRERLAELTSKILSDNIVPSMELFIGRLNETIDSETYDFMLERIRDDLEAIFSEANTIAEVVDAHSNLVNNIILKAIKLGLTELDSKVSMYEFLATNRNGFDNAQFNTFRATQNSRTYRTAPDSGVLFRDPRANKIIDSDITMDTLGERILLGTSDSKFIDIKDIRQIFDAEATQSETIVAFESSSIRNAIDGSRGTYWIYSILQRRINPAGVTAKIELHLPSPSDINFIEIEAASIYTMNLVRIEYVDVNGAEKNISIFETLINGNNRISFNNICTAKLRLVVQQKNALELQYEDKVLNTNFTKAVMGENSSVDVDSIAQEVRNLITSSRVLQDAIMVSQEVTPGLSVKLYDYAIGFDNIRVGHASYTEESVFVSAPLTVNKLSQLAIRAKELRPLETSGAISIVDNTYPASDPGYFHGSVEYCAVIQNFNINDQLINISNIPLLPIGVTYISHERLVLSEKLGSSDVPNSGKLRFYTAHFTTPEKNAVLVYRSGSLLTRDVHWIFEDYPFTNDVRPPNGLPNTVGIRILSPTTTDFYTVSYTPLVSTTRVNAGIVGNLPLEFATSNLRIVDLVGDASVTMGLNNIVSVASKKNAGQIVEYSKVHLSVIIRRSSPNSNLSSAVEEYMLLTSTSNPEKFKGNNG